MEEDIKESIKRLFNALKNNKIKTLHLTQPYGFEKKKTSKHTYSRLSVEKHPLNI